MTLLTKIGNNWYFSLKVIHGCFGNGLFWIRITNGAGMQIKDTTKHPLMFSERNAITKSLTFGKWHISKINPSPKQYIARLILSPIIFIGATLLSMSLWIFPWWLVVGMHLVNLVYEIIRLPFTYLGVETPNGDEPIVTIFGNNIINNFAGIFLPLIMPFYVTYNFAKDGKIN